MADSNVCKYSKKQLVELFFGDLKRYNNSNFKAIANADLTKKDAAVHKAFSSVVTRYFIFKEKHPELSDTDHRMLYYLLKLDLIAVYFSEFPDTSTDYLVAFQLELKRYIRECKRKGEDLDATEKQESSLPNIQLETDNTVPVEQQQELVSVS